MEATPPGFYPDPQGPPGQNRYWDGSRWTDQVQQSPGPPWPPQVPQPWGYPPPGGYPGYQPRGRTSGLAVASLVLSIVWLGGLGSVLAVIFALRARGDVRRSRGFVTGDGLATAGLVIGIIGIVGAVAFWSIAISAGNAIRRAITPTNVALGQTVHLRSDVPFGDGISQVTVYSVQYPVTSEDPVFSSPPGGEEYAAADVRVCAGAHGSTSGPDEFDFELIFPGGQDIAPSPVDIRKPAIADAGSLGASQCVRAFVAYAIPVGSHPTSIQYLLFDAFRWVLPPTG